MNNPGSTCWTLIRGAAAGGEQDQEEFARRYEGVVRAYLTARWKVDRGAHDVADATQAVFLECFKEGGVLDAARDRELPDFRAYLFAVVRNVARRFERVWNDPREGRPPTSVDLYQIERSEATLSQVFDRAWAEGVVAEAKTLQSHLAESKGEGARRRVELLRLRFQEGLPIREISRRWDASPRWVHHQYEQARAEFEKALLKVVHFHHPESPERAQRELSQVLATLGSRFEESDPT